MMQLGEYPTEQELKTMVAEVDQVDRMMMTMRTMMTIRTMMAMISAYDGKIGQHLFYNSAIKI